MYAFSKQNAPNDLMKPAVLKTISPLNVKNILPMFLIFDIYEMERACHSITCVPKLLQ